MSGFDVLRRYLEERDVFTEQELAFVQSLFSCRTLSAGEFLQRAGDVARYAAFVVKGCLRTYVIDDKGKEHIVNFAPETWWVSDNTSLTTGTPSQYFIDAIEESTLLLIGPDSHDKLVENVPAYAAAFRRGLQKHAAAKDTRIVKSLSSTAEERYLDFLKTYPSIASRVPQWMLASYLGISAETVSRIRKNLAKRSTV
jgi:CRP-like cAMP-binding protein